MTLGPWIFGRAVDEGIVGGSEAALAGWAALLLLVVVIGGVFGVVSHTLVVRSWLVASTARSRWSPARSRRWATCCRAARRPARC